LFCEIRKADCRRGRGAIYYQDGHSFTLRVPGIEKRLSGKISHDDRKSFSRWWAAQKKYVKLEAHKLTTTSFNELNPQDKLRKMIVFAPGIVFFIVFSVKD